MMKDKMHKKRHNDIRTEKDKINRKQKNKITKYLVFLFTLERQYNIRTVELPI